MTEYLQTTTAVAAGLVVIVPVLVALVAITLSALVLRRDSRGQAR